MTYTRFNKTSKIDLDDEWKCRKLYFIAPIGVVYHKSRCSSNQQNISDVSNKNSNNTWLQYYSKMFKKGWHCFYMRDVITALIPSCKVKQLSWYILFKKKIYTKKKIFFLTFFLLFVSRKHFVTAVWMI